MSRTLAKIVLAAVLIAASPGRTLAGAGDQRAAAVASQQDYTDPWAPFNDKMFSFNMKLDHYVLRPVASGYAAVVPAVVRRKVGNFFDNVNVIPRMVNNAFQLRMVQAGSELARLGINSTLGVAGLFDVADHWFGIKQSDNDFGLTLRRYGAPTGPYLVLPFFGPSTPADAAGLLVDGAMNPLNYLVPFYVAAATDTGKSAAEAVNYRSLNLELFEDVDRYAVDLYGAVQDGYLQRRNKQGRDGSLDR